MLPVYICEDEPEIRAAQREYLEKLILIEGYDMEIVMCSGHPEDIVEAVKESPGRGIYFLDIELRGESMDGFGLEAGFAGIPDLCDGFSGSCVRDFQVSSGSVGLYCKG